MVGCIVVPPGAGHFVKMVHNGVEYGIMQAYAEGFNILHEANAGSKYVKEGDAEVFRWKIQQIIVMILTALRLLSYGGAVVLWVAGCLILPLMFYAAIEKLSKFGGGVSDSGGKSLDCPRCCGSWCSRSCYLYSII